MLQMLMHNALAMVAGLVLVFVTLYDVFASVVVPRWTGRALRLAPHFSMFVWPAWKRLARRLERGLGESRREDFLAAYAPFTLLALLALWIVTFVLGFALILWAMRGQVEGDHGLLDSIFLAGVAFLTIGMGEVLPEGNASRFFTLLAGATGTALTALVISLSFTLYGSFSRRESLILTLEARAGTPPSGVVLLETHAQFELLEDLPALFDRWETWGAEVLESHLAYPLLPFFRSPHAGLSWVGALGAVLDAATLLISAVRPGGACGQRPIGSAHLMYHMGCRILDDLSVNLFNRHARRAADRGEEGEPDARVSRDDFDKARRRLEKAGFELRDEDEAWGSFVRHRAVYASALEELAEFYAAPATLWIGDRSTVSFAARHDSHPRAVEA